MIEILLIIIAIVLVFGAGVIVGAHNANRINVDVANLRQDLARGIPDIKAAHAATAAVVAEVKTAAVATKVAAETVAASVEKAV